VYETPRDVEEEDSNSTEEVVLPATSSWRDFVKTQPFYDSTLLLGTSSRRKAVTNTTAQALSSMSSRRQTQTRKDVESHELSGLNPVDYWESFSKKVDEDGGGVKRATRTILETEAEWVPGVLSGKSTPMFFEKEEQKYAVAVSQKQEVDDISSASPPPAPSSAIISPWREFTTVYARTVHVRTLDVCASRAKEDGQTLGRWT
ncbi:unnamed protein product, partial [Amoebophrya sp. A25]